MAIAKLLINKGANVNAQGGIYGNALQAASYQGHKAIAKLLLDKEANVNAQGGFYGNAFHAASYGGHKAIAELLIEKGVDTNAPEGDDHLFIMKLQMKLDDMIRNDDLGRIINMFC